MNARVIPASLATLALALLATGPAWALTCQPVNGHSATQVSFPQDGCTAPGGLCTSGSLVGGLQGSLEVRALSTQGDLDARIPSVLRFIGESLITTKDGDTLLGIDVGAINTAPPTDGRVGTLLVWVDGTGRYAGASGEIVINGVVDLVNKTVVTDYRGRVCTP